MLQYFQMSFLILGIGIRKREKIVDSKECINKKQTDILKAFCAIVPGAYHRRKTAPPDGAGRQNQGCFRPGYHPTVGFCAQGRRK